MTFSSSQVNVLLVGSGGREHTIAWKLLRSARIGRLFVAPGNGGTFEYNVPIATTDIQALVDFAKKNNCFTIIGPEAPLEAGLVDELLREGLSSFGPRKNEARLETSKAFAKEFMKEAHIPTASFLIFHNYTDALDYSNSMEGNVVIKADGLASGKGVFVCSGKDEADNALRAIFVERVFGNSGNSAVIEEKLSGFEVSFIAICDGKQAQFFGTAMDHKRLLDGNKGPNTGGMGAFSPAINFDQQQINQVLEEIVRPTVKKSGFKGFLYTGLMITKDGPKVLEFNARLGDPETQCILPRLKSDLLATLLEIDTSGLEDNANTLNWNEKYSCCVVMCSRGYPSKSIETGFEIDGLANAQEREQVNIFHSGTKIVNGRLVTSGGRVLSVNALGQNLTEASDRAYSAVKMISWAGENHRSDIGKALPGC